MWTRCIEDLRFVIGLFFGILACILTSTGLFHKTDLNLMTGLCMGIFSTIMLFISIRKQAK